MFYFILSLLLSFKGLFAFDSYDITQDKLIGMLEFYKKIEFQPLEVPGTSVHSAHAWIPYTGLNPIPPTYVMVLGRTSSLVRLPFIESLSQMGHVLIYVHPGIGEALKFDWEQATSVKATDKYRLNLDKGLMETLDSAFHTFFKEKLLPLMEDRPLTFIAESLGNNLLLNNLLREPSFSQAMKTSGSVMLGFNPTLGLSNLGRELSLPPKKKTLLGSLSLLGKSFLSGLSPYDLLFYSKTYSKIIAQNKDLILSWGIAPGVVKKEMSPKPKYSSVDMVMRWDPVCSLVYFEALNKLSKKMAIEDCNSHHNFLTDEERLDMDRFENSLLGKIKGSSESLDFIHLFYSGKDYFANNRIFKFFSPIRRAFLQKGASIYKFNEAGHSILSGSPRDFNKALDYIRKLKP